MTDLLDQRLVEAGRRWRAEQPPPPGVPLARLEPSAPRLGRRRAVAVAAAAAVIVGAVTAVLMRATGGGLTGAPSTTTPPSPEVQRAIQVVPWRALPAHHPTLGHLAHGRRVTPYDNLFASGLIRGHVHPGDTMEFTVVLESPVHVTLAPCPDYGIAFGRHTVYRWRLNCAQVPYQDPLGRPVLPAVTPVRFDMRLTVPDVRGRQKVLWTLEGPTAMPGFYGIVKVSP